MTLSDIEILVGFGVLSFGIVSTWVEMRFKLRRAETEIESLKKSHDDCAERQVARWEKAQKLSAEIADATALAEKSLYAALTDRWTQVATSLHQIELKHIQGLADMGQRLVRLEQQLDDLLNLIRNNGSGGAK